MESLKIYILQKKYVLLTHGVDMLNCHSRQQSAIPKRSGSPLSLVRYLQGGGEE